MIGSGRTYARIYENVRRGDVHAFVERAVETSGGRILFSSGPSAAPLFLSIEMPEGDRVGVAAYVFLGNRVLTRNRPASEHRAQIRYGDVNSREWREARHPLGFDRAGLDLTLVLVADIDAGVVVALDPLAYDPLPLGNSIYFDAEFIEAAAAENWHVWERNTFGGTRKGPVDPALETVIGFAPERFIDYLAVERQAQTLRLDQPLRFRLAERGAHETVARTAHELEKEYGLPAHDLLDMISINSRLGMAVRGGVAEHHLGRVFEADPEVQTAEPGKQEGPPDYRVTLVDGRHATVECKNASPKVYADGTPKVEVQKTRASQGDRSSRFYSPAAFDVVAACMYGPTKEWTFRFRRSDLLVEHGDHPGRISPLQRIDDGWTHSLAEALAAA